MNAPDLPLPRRYVLAVVGQGGAIDPSLADLAEELGFRAAEAGFRVVTGGLGGVMEAVSRGARSAPGRHEGDVVGVLPGYDRRDANPYVDLVIPTGMGIGRNIIVVAMADVVIALGGGSGTLSEIAVGWQLGKPIIALPASGGWAAQLAGERVDPRRSDVIHGAAGAEEAVALALALAAQGGVATGDASSR